MLTIGHLRVRLSLMLKLHLRQPRAWLCQIIASRLTLLQTLVGMAGVGCCPSSGRQTHRL